MRLYAEAQGRRTAVSPLQRLHERKTKPGGGRSLCMPQIPNKA